MDERATSAVKEEPDSATGIATLENQTPNAAVTGVGETDYEAFYTQQCAALDEAMTDEDSDSTQLLIDEKILSQHSLPEQFAIRAIAACALKNPTMISSIVASQVTFDVDMMREFAIMGREMGITAVAFRQGMQMLQRTNKPDETYRRERSIAYRAQPPGPVTPHRQRDKEKPRTRADVLFDEGRYMPTRTMPFATVLDMIPKTCGLMGYKKLAPALLTEFQKCITGRMHVERIYLTLPPQLESPRRRRQKRKFNPVPSASTESRVAALEALVQSQQARGEADDAAWTEYMTSRSGGLLCDNTGHVFFPQTWDRQLRGYCCVYMHDDRYYIGGSFLADEKVGFARAFGLWQAVRHSICVNDIWAQMQKMIKDRITARLSAARRSLNDLGIKGRSDKEELEKRQNELIAAAKASETFRYTELPAPSDHLAISAICSQIPCEQARGPAFNALRAALMDSRLVTRMPAQPMPQLGTPSRQLLDVTRKPEPAPTAQTGTGAAQSTTAQTMGSSRVAEHAQRTQTQQPTAEQKTAAPEKTVTTETAETPPAKPTKETSAE